MSLRQPNELGVSPSFGSRLAGIEGVRALAAVSILIYHAWLYMSPDGARVDFFGASHVLPDFAFGVILFFTLSGFLLYRPFAAAALRTEPRPSTAAYLRNRALRILPNYWVIFFICALIFQSVLTRDPSGRLVNGSLHGADHYVADSLLVQHYRPSTVVTGVGPAWSLAVEIAFYLLLPLLALLAFWLARRASTRAGRRLALLVPPILLLVVGATGKATAAYLVPPDVAYNGWGPTWHAVIERSIWCNADLFAFGMMLTIARLDWEDGLLRLHRRWRPAVIVLAFGTYCLAAAMTAQREQLSYSPWNTVIAFVCALFLALVVLPGGQGGKPTLFVGVLETRPLVAIGIVSYSVFLWHEPLARFLQAHGWTFEGNLGYAANVLVLLVVTLILSTLSYRLVEAPALRLRSRRRATRPAEDLVVPQAAP